MEYYSAVKKKSEIMMFTMTRMDPESIMLSEVTQRKANTIWFHLCEIQKA